MDEGDMATRKRREQQRDDLREKILDAARELFVQEGIEQVSMRKVGEKIGYSATTLYNHFPDKDAMLRAICETDFLALREGFERINKITDPLERLRTLGLAYVQFALKHPSHYRLMFMTPHIHGMELDCHNMWKGNPDQDAYAFLKANVAAAIGAGYFRAEYLDPDLVAQIMWSGVHGVVALHLIMSGDPWLDWRPVETIAAGVIEATLTGLLLPQKRK
jgi:AcrR family transcriptional regulator